MTDVLQVDRTPVRVLRVRLGGGGLERAAWEDWSDPRPGIDVIGHAGGSGLAAALLFDAPSDRVPLVITVGPGVRNGLPTAGRATVASRAPLGGRYAEGQVGGELAARLASLGSALVIEGSTGSDRAQVLVLEQDGSVRLEAATELVGRTVADCAALLEARFGSQASLRIGSAGIGGVAFASLASGGARPSFVGRGGLGAVLGASGLCAVVVRAEPEPPRKPAQALVEALTSSPRLAQRSAQGTTELWHALSARGELNAMEDDSPLDPERGVALARSAREAGRERHGCRGCPTPCGWVFERSTGERQRSHFGAAHAVGPALGLDDFDDSLTLLARCDALGVDAKEAGAVLATWGRAVDAGVVDGPDPRGDVDALVATLDRLIEDPRARSGAAHLARELGLDLARLPWLERSVRPGVSGTALLGQCVSTGGSDPMRSFPFLSDEASPERLAVLVGLERPAPGQLVWWHENLVAALDASGFCAFSAAGTLADGVLDLDRLAQALGHVDGDELLALGASIVLARRSLETRWGIGGERDRPSALVERLDRPEMLPAYRAARGIDADGAPLGEVWENLGRRRLARPWAAPVLEATAVEIEPARASLAEHSSTAVVEITVRATGTLADALGAPVGLQLFPGATVGDLMGELARRHPNAERLLGEPVRSPVSVWRAGLRLDVDTALVDGDRIDLVLAIAGG